MGPPLPMSASHPIPTKVVIPLLPKNEHVCTRSPWAEMEDLWGKLVFYRRSLDLPLHFCWQCWWIFLYKHLHLGKMKRLNFQNMEVFWFRCFVFFNWVILRFKTSIFRGVIHWSVQALHGKYPFPARAVENHGRTQPNDRSNETQF